MFRGHGKISIPHNWTKYHKLSSFAPTKSGSACFSCHIYYSPKRRFRSGYPSWLFGGETGLNRLKMISLSVPPRRRRCLYGLSSPCPFSQKISHPPSIPGLLAGLRCQDGLASPEPSRPLPGYCLRCRLFHFLFWLLSA